MALRPIRIPGPCWDPRAPIMVPGPPLWSPRLVITGTPLWSPSPSVVLMPFEVLGLQVSEPIPLLTFLLIYVVVPHHCYGHMLSEKSWNPRILFFCIQISGRAREGVTGPSHAPEYMCILIKIVAVLLVKGKTFSC